MILLKPVNDFDHVLTGPLDAGVRRAIDGANGRIENYMKYVSQIPTSELFVTHQRS